MSKRTHFIITLLACVVSFDIFAQQVKTVTNRALDKDLCLQVNDGGVASEGLCIKGTDASVELNNSLTINGGASPELILSDNTSPTVGFDRPAGASYKIENDSGILKVKVGTPGIANATSEMLRVTSSGVESRAEVVADLGFTGSTSNAPVRFYAWEFVWSGSLGSGARINTHGSFGALQPLGTGAYRQQVTGMCTTDAICTANTTTNDGKTNCKVINATATNSEVRCKDAQTDGAVNVSGQVTCMCY